MSLVEDKDSTQRENHPKIYHRHAALYAMIRGKSPPLQWYGFVESKLSS